MSRKLIIGALLSASGALLVASYLRDQAVAPTFEQAGEAVFVDAMPCRKGTSIDEFQERPLLQPCNELLESEDQEAGSE